MFDEINYAQLQRYANHRGKIRASMQNNPPKIPTKSLGHIFNTALSTFLVKHVNNIHTMQFLTTIPRNNMSKILYIFIAEVCL